MAEFSIQDAAFTGFRVVREHPRALGIWALYALVLSLMLGVILVALMGPGLAELTAANAEATKDPARVLAAAGRLAPGYVLLLVVALVFNSILGAAMIRAVLAPAEARFGFLRLGADELRQMGLAALTLVVFIGIYFGLVIVIAVIVAVASLSAKPAVAATVVFNILFSLGALLFLGVRLSLAPALTFAAGRIDLFGSWGLTRGRFWPLLGTYLLTFAMVAVVWLLGLLVILAVMTVMNGGVAIAGLTRPGTVSPGAYFTPARLVQTVLSAGISALVWPVALTPPAAIYARLTGAGAGA
jgi:hypothetical protein